MNNLKYILIIILGTATFVLAPQNLSGAQEYYTWIDENGVTNYSQRNPQGYQAQRVSKKHKFGEQVFLEQRSTPTTQVAAPTEIDPDALVADQVAAEARRIARTKRSNCEIGKKNLTNLQAFSRIRVTQDDGTVRILTPAEKAAKTETARQVIRENCTG
ncbi:MAG: hypothetical protein ACI9UN_002435 [Granulosicoccus sp.]|jgi:hypothetical protein